MQQQKGNLSTIDTDEDTKREISEIPEENDLDMEDDKDSPVLDEEDLEENNLTEEEADEIEWEPEENDLPESDPKTEEKDTI